MRRYNLHFRQPSILEYLATSQFRSSRRCMWARLAISNNEGGLMFMKGSTIRGSRRVDLIAPIPYFHNRQVSFLWYTRSPKSPGWAMVTLIIGRICVSYLHDLNCLKLWHIGLHNITTWSKKVLSIITSWSLASVTWTLLYSQEFM